MTKHRPIFAPQGDDRAREITKIVIMVVGGQGGGVLTNWIETVCRNAGRAVQATSVAGVAQRTGATIYYIEIGSKDVIAPVFSLAPAAGDVDVLIAAELMEAGRAIQRGFVTPDRTTLIASTHRALAVSEKMTPGNGISNGEEVIAATEVASARLILADMEKLAVDCGSAISASLFGGLAGSGALPFERSDYEDAIRASGKGVTASLAAFSAGFDAAAKPVNTISEDAPPSLTELVVEGPEPLKSRWADQMQRVEVLPSPAQDMARHGLRKVIEFQDLDYGEEYLTQVEAFAKRDRSAQEFTLTVEAAKYIANAMAYDDVIRVADRKTRPDRFARIDRELNRKGEQGLQLTEYFHPRAEEISGLLPARLGQRVEASKPWMARLNRWFCKGRRIRTDRLAGFSMLFALATLKRWRRGTLRHKIEAAHIQDWLTKVDTALAKDYALAVEVLRCRRLIKGYSDTHRRGLSKFDQVLSGAELVANREDAADWVRRLREAALMDEAGDALEGAMQTIASFTKPGSA